MPRGENFRGRPGPGRPPGLQNKATREVKEFLQKVFLGKKYRVRVARDLEAGDVPPGVEIAMLHIAFGKPKETVELQDETTKAFLDPSKLSDKDLAALRVIVKKANAGPND